ncbi:MAG: hypothetical protein BWZ07_02856 [Alphaproteobacteria bacterium ADurb.BinA280]|nr:MAG: hypothetical protein BWZ07_02856 [Alphaproteobacteria bacterium ADurb.BinA280]
MQGLKKRMLTACTGPTPKHGHSVVGDRRTVMSDRLAQALHHNLLQMVRQQTKPLVIGQDGLRPVAEEIAIPNCQQAMQDRQVVLERRIQSMLVNGCGTVQQRIPSLRTKRQTNRPADSRPQRITSPHPIPHRENSRGRDSSFNRRVWLGRYRVKP